MLVALNAVAVEEQQRRQRQYNGRENGHARVIGCVHDKLRDALRGG